MTKKASSKAGGAMWLEAFDIHPHTWVCEWWPHNLRGPGRKPVRCICTTKRDVKELSLAIGAYKVDWLQPSLSGRMGDK